MANAAVLKGKSCVGVLLGLAPFFLLVVFAALATKRKSGWGICGSSCFGVMVLL